MSKTRRVVAGVLSLLAASIAAAPIASADSDKKCAPGQHGNPHPAFKPGSC